MTHGFIMLDWKVRQHKQAVTTYHDMRAILKLAYTQPKAPQGDLSLQPPLPYLVRRPPRGSRTSYCISFGARPGAEQVAGSTKAKISEITFFASFWFVLPRVLKAKPGPPQGLPPALFPTPLAPKALGKTSRKRPLYIRGSPGGRGRVNFIISHARGSVSLLLRISLLDGPMIYVDNMLCML